MRGLYRYFFLGGFRLCGSTGTVLGPGFNVSGFFLGVGDGVDLLCGFTRTVFVAMILNFGFFTYYSDIFFQVSVVIKNSFLKVLFNS